MSSRLSFNDDYANLSLTIKEDASRNSFSDDDSNEIVDDLIKMQNKRNTRIFHGLGSFLHHKVADLNHFIRPSPKRNKKVNKIAQLIAPLGNDYFSTRDIRQICTYIDNHRKKWEVLRNQSDTNSLYIRHNKKLPCTLSVEATGEVFLILKTVIGSGSFKKVKFALSYDNQQLVANAVTRLEGKYFIQTAKAEAKIGKRLKGSPYVVPYLFTEEYTSKYGNCSKQRILQVYYNGGCLWENLAKGRTFTPSQIKKIMGDILRGVQHIHDHQILHRDLKLENIFLHKEKMENGNTFWHASIGDFGLGTKLSKMKAVSGTVDYIAPEMKAACKLAGEEFNIHLKSITYSADLYSLGVIFDRFLDAAWINAKLSDAEPKLSDFPKDLYYLSTKLRSKNPIDRGTISEALELLEEMNWDPFYNAVN